MMSGLAFRIAAALIAVAGLAACEGATMTHYLNQQPLTARSYWRAAGAGKTLYLQVHGAPEGVSPEALAAVFPSPPTVAPGRFTADPAQADDPQYRFVLAFDTSTAFSGDHACLLGPKLQPRSAGGEGSLMAAFCYRDEMLTQIRADGAAEVLARGLDRAPARNLLFQLSNRLVPPPERDADIDRRVMR